MPIPQSLPWMESTDAKFARALEHFEAYNLAAAAFVESVEHNVMIKVNPGTGARWIVMWESDQYPPLRLATIVGDVLFNLRSALDNLVCGLARSVDTFTACRKLEFPICTTPDLFDVAVNRRKRLTGLPDHAVRAIEAVQPFQTPSTVEIHPLWLLHELNNLDKHQSVHISIGATQRCRVIIFNEREEELHTVELPSTINLGPVHVDLPSDLPDNIHASASGTFVLSFRGYEQLAERSIHEVLATCIRYVELQVLDTMRPFFHRE